MAQQERIHLPIQKTWVRSLHYCIEKILWEKEMTTPSSILACEIPWTEELGTLQCVGLQKCGVAKAWGCTRAGYGLAIKQQHQGLWNDHVLCCAVLSQLQLYPILCNPVDYSLPDSSVQGVLQVRILEWVAVPSSRGSSQPWNQTHISSISCIADRFSTWEAPGMIIILFK